MKKSKWLYNGKEFAKLHKGEYIENVVVEDAGTVHRGDLSVSKTGDLAIIVTAHYTVRYSENALDSVTVILADQPL